MNTDPNPDAVAPTLEEMAERYDPLNDALQDASAAASPGKLWGLWEGSDPSNRQSLVTRAGTQIDRFVARLGSDEQAHKDADFVELLWNSFREGRLAALARSPAVAPGVPAGTLNVRPEVAAFALLMERELRANDDKGGWKEDDATNLAHRVSEEADELYEVASSYEVACLSPVSDPFKSRIASEAADVANMAMMVADVCGCLDLAALSPDAQAGAGQAPTNAVGGVALPGVEAYPWLLRGVGDNGPESVSYLDPDGWTDDLSEATGYLLRINADGAAADAKLEGIKVEVVHRNVVMADAARLAAAGTGDARRDHSGDVAEMVDEEAGLPVRISYINWRGEQTAPRILPQRMFWGSNEWHPEPGWLIEAVDLDKGAVRTYALRKILAWDIATPPAPAAAQSPAAGVDLREAVQNVLYDIENHSSYDGLACVAWEVIAALRIALDAPSSDRGGARDGWQDIATAPKDGTPILICDAPNDSMRWAVWAGGIWRDGTVEARGQMSGVPCPTHWRPLPTLPTTTGAGL